MSLGQTLERQVEREREWAKQPFALPRLQKDSMAVDILAAICEGLVGRCECQSAHDTDRMHARLPVASAFWRG